MNKSILRITNKLERLSGQAAARIFRKYQTNPGWLTCNRFPIGDGIAHIRYRAHDEGDWGAVHQVFHCLDYRVDMWPQGRALAKHYEAISGQQIPLVIDAGANIGASSVYFSAQYPEAVVRAVEPERENCRVLRINAANRPVEVFEAALGRGSGKLFLQDPGLSSWGFRVGNEGSYEVEVVTMERLMKFGNEPLVPFILKIDIEGGEDAVFDGDSPWLEHFALLVIELHDWMLPGSGSSNNFLRQLAKHDFDVLHRGENLFCFNNATLGPYYQRSPTS